MFEGRRKQAMERITHLRTNKQHFLAVSPKPQVGSPSSTHACVCHTHALCNNGRGLLCCWTILNWRVIQSRWSQQAATQVGLLFAEKKKSISVRQDTSTRMDPTHLKVNCLSLLLSRVCLHLAPHPMLMQIIFNLPDFVICNLSSLFY